MLLTVLATFPFLGALAIAAFALQASIAGNYGKIIAALRGESPLAVGLVTRPVTVQFNSRPAPVRMPVHAEPRWRVAA